jgi:hypothetical protein
MTPAFHIPGLFDQQAEARYRELAAGYQVPTPPPNERPFRPTFRNNETGKIITAEVGNHLAPNWSPVMAILPGPPTVVVCAEQHKHSFIVPAGNIIDTEMFGEDEPSDTGLAA